MIREVQREPTEQMGARHACDFGRNPELIEKTMLKPRTAEDLSKTLENAPIPRVDKKKLRAASGTRTGPKNRRTRGRPHPTRQNDEPDRGNQGDGANRREEHGTQRDRENLSRAQRSGPMPQVLQRKLEDVPRTSIIPGDRKTQGGLERWIER